MAGKMVQTVRDKHVLVNVKGRCNSLSKYVGDIVVGITAVVELSAESALPLLSLHDVVSVWSVENESLELQLADPADLGSHFEG